MTNSKTVGNSDFQFDANSDWAQRPDGVNWLDVVAVHFSAENNVYVYNRGDREMIY